MTHAYEEIVRLLEHLVPPEVEGQFHVEWLGDEQIAIGVDHRHKYTLLVVGPAIQPRIEVVASAMREGAWTARDGRVLAGSMLHLPSGDAFRTALATIAAELFRRGVEARPPSEVFAEVEPFIALVISRMLLPASYVLGLVGELLVLRELLASSSTLMEKADPTSVWRGCEQQARDIVLSRVSFEVKTTALAVSRHHVGSLEQIEPRFVDDQATERLFLVSVGLRRASGSTGLSVAGLAQDIVELLRQRCPSAPEAVVKFLDRLSTYGPESFDGYRHESMRTQEPYTDAFTTTFPPRVYDMGDENIRVVRRSDLARDFGCVLPAGMQFTIELPNEVPGSIENPRIDLAEVLRGVATDSVRVEGSARDAS